MWQLLFKALVFSAMLLAGTVESQEKSCRNEIDLIDQILQSYVKKTAPRESSGGPIKIEVEVWIQNFHQLDQDDNELKLDLYLSAIWNDERLRYAHLNPCRKEVILMDGSVLWKPDIAFIDSRKSEIYATPIVNDFTLVYASGKVWSNQRLRMTIPCTFRKIFQYPYDEIECSTVLESYRFGKRDIDLNWGSQRITMMNDGSLSGYTLTNYTSTKNDTEYPAGQWTDMKMALHFHRDTMSTFLYTFVPAILAVFAAGITFFLGRKSSVARAILAASALFFLIYLARDVGHESPTYSSFKMIDIYMSVCILFVCSALIELALANGCSNCGHYELNGSSEGFKPLTQSKSSGQLPVRFCRRHCGKFDVSAGVLYFGLFVAWNVVYFLVLVAI